MQGCTYEKSYKKKIILKKNLIYIKLRKNHRWIIPTPLKIKHT
jgi:hypothetical protein